MNGPSLPEAFRLHLRHKGDHQVGPVWFRLKERLGLSIRIDSLLLAQPVFLDAMIDTGCPLPLVFPRLGWERFEPAIQWISPEYEAALPESLRSGQGASGGRLAFRLGAVFVTPYDADYTASLPRKPRLAAFIQNESPLGD